MRLAHFYSLNELLSTLHISTIIETLMINAVAAPGGHRSSRASRCFRLLVQAGRRYGRRKNQRSGRHPPVFAILPPERAGTRRHGHVAARRPICDLRANFSTATNLVASHGKLLRRPGATCLTPRKPGRCWHETSPSFRPDSLRFGPNPLPSSARRSGWHPTPRRCVSCCCIGSLRAARSHGWPSRKRAAAAILWRRNTHLRPVRFAVARSSAKRRSPGRQGAARPLSSGQRDKSGCSPERHGQIASVMKAQIDHLCRQMAGIPRRPKAAPWP